MSIKSVLLTLFVCALCPKAWAELVGTSSQTWIAPYAVRNPAVYGEVSLGIASGKATGPAFMLRGVKQFGLFDFSVGYMNLYGMKANGLQSTSASLPTINMEITRVFLTQTEDELSFGGGFGYTMPSLAPGVNEQADNDVSFTAVAAFKHPLSRKYDLLLSARGFFFSTDSQLTTYGSHNETLLINGVPAGQVEVADETHSTDRLNFNSVMFMAALRWE